MTTTTMMMMTPMAMTTSKLTAMILMVMVRQSCAANFSEMFLTPLSSHFIFNNFQTRCQPVPYLGRRLSQMRRMQLRLVLPESSCNKVFASA